MFKHTGDGVCAAFASPTSAVDAALAAQWAVELPVRMGIATGEAELRGADYVGAVLNRAAQVMAAGHGGQILLVGLTASLISGVDLVDLGPHRLRDLPTPVGVFQVRLRESSELGEPVGQIWIVHVRQVVTGLAKLFCVSEADIASGSKPLVTRIVGGRLRLAVDRPPP